MDSLSLLWMLQPRYIRNDSDSTLKDSPASKKRRRAAKTQQPLAKKTHNKTQPVGEKNLNQAVKLGGGGLQAEPCRLSIILLLGLLLLFFFHHV